MTRTPSRARNTLPRPGPSPARTNLDPDSRRLVPDGLGLRPGLRTSRPSRLGRRLPARRHASHERRIRALSQRNRNPTSSVLATTQTSTIHSSRSPRSRGLKPLRYCEWLHSQTARAYRLPTEAEWEHAARAASNRKHFPGVTTRRNPSPTTPRAGKPAPNPSAATPPTPSDFTTSGDNVHEWCSDWYDPNYYAISPDRNPRGPEQSPMNPQRKSSRGGSWRHQIKVSRCSARSSIPPEFQYADYGFRVACNVEPYVLYSCHSEPGKAR